jgi:prepilin-type N-terminal cleavage/methylation domain-containing protein/prepilin-type processing-associated H-X9-DG protein
MLTARRRDAFTLIELLVVVALIAVLVGILVPAVQKAREVANRDSCQNNLRQIALALHHYHDGQSCLPAGYVASGSYVDGASDTSPGWGWGALILPYLEQGNLAETIDFTLPIEDPKNAPAIKTFVKPYLCPSDVWTQEPFAITDAFSTPICSVAPMSYTACCGNDESDTTGPTGNGVFYRNSHVRLTDISDGTSSTIMIGEKAWSSANGTWAGAIQSGVIVRGQLNPCLPIVPGASFPAPTLVLSHAHLNNAQFDADGSAGMDDFCSRHAGGSNFLFADGSVHFIRNVAADNPDGTYTPKGVIFQALGTRAGAEVVPPDWIN